ncbi:ATP-binding protein [Sinomonas humi]|uniref:Transcriptional regulator n=1 Tax=Sinomonas humi TaxID=1338436 RepID=A0A0B2AFY4_9MICC|nr:ATP-binding protein [Sinomonas humi]KHL02429.1 transcriptional regulator [Sinomonas humi]
MDVEELREVAFTLRRVGSDLEDVEAKRADGGLPKSVRETLSAFANTHGGLLLLGLDEQSGFTVVDIADPGKMAADLASACAEMEPPLRADIKVAELEGKPIIVAEIPEADRRSKPCYIRSVGMNRGSYIRVNDADQKMTSYEIQLMLANQGQPRDDVAPADGSNIEDLRPEGVSAYVNRLRTLRPNVFGSLESKEVLRLSNVLVEANGKLVPSLAGLLALGRFPQQRYPQLMLTFVSYPTVEGPEPEGTRFLDNVSIEGPIPEMVTEALKVIRRNMSRRAVVSGAGRRDLWDYPEPALREAIVNALVHRDLSPESHGTQVQVEMYPDRLEIRNPGGLFGPVHVNALGTDPLSSSRNAALLRMLEDVQIPGEDRTVCENRGSGIRTMISALRAAGMSTPIFRDNVSSFSVTFPNHSLLNSDLVEWIASLNEPGLTESQILALAHLRDGDALDNGHYREMAAVDSRVATQELQDLVARELTEQDGKGRWATYRLAPRLHDGNVALPKGERLPPADRRDEILAAFQPDETLSRAALVERTGLGDQVVRRWLRILRDEGYVEFTGAASPQSKNVQYRRTIQTYGNQQQATLDFDV